MAVSIVEFPKMNSSTMAKIEMAKYFHLKWEIALVNGNLWEERRRWKEWKYQLWSFQK